EEKSLEKPQRASSAKTRVDEPDAPAGDPNQTIDSIPNIAPPKNPTVTQRVDQTMEFDTLASIENERAAPRGPRATHALESDKTIDLDMSPSDVRHLDSHWRDTIDPGAKHGQTIRARETVTGFRSTLPVKSRYVRDKRKDSGEPPRTLADVPDYDLLDII